MEKLKVCMNPSLPTSYAEALSYLEEIGKLRYKLDQVIAAVNAGQTFYILPIATDTTLGGVKAISKTDESHKVAIDADGQIWSAYPTIADNQTLGLVKGTVKTDEDAMVAVDENGEMWYKTPEIATDKIAGIVKAIIKDAQTHKVAIDTEGLLSLTEWAEAKAKRAAWRKEVNDNEILRDESKAKVDAIIAKYRGNKTPRSMFESCCERDNAIFEKVRAYFNKEV